MIKLIYRKENLLTKDVTIKEFLFHSVELRERFWAALQKQFNGHVNIKLVRLQ
jgi:hypothetical protein